MNWIKDTSKDHIEKGRMVELVSDDHPFMFVPEQRVKEHGEEFAYFLTLMWAHEQTGREAPMPEEEKLNLPPKPKWGTMEKADHTKPKYVWMPWKQMEQELSLHILPERIELLFYHAEAGELITIHPYSDTDKGEIYVKSTDV